MKPFRSFVPPLAAMLMAASGGASAQGVLIDKSEIRFVVETDGRERRRPLPQMEGQRRLSSEGAREIEGELRDRAREHRPRERGVGSRNPALDLVRHREISRREIHVDRDDAISAATVTRSPARCRSRALTKDIVVPVALRKDAAGNSVAEGQFTLKRLEYRIGEGLWADTDAVADDVVVRVRMVLPPIR